MKLKAVAAWCVALVYRGLALVGLAAGAVALVAPAHGGTAQVIVRETDRALAPHLSAHGDTAVLSWVQQAGPDRHVLWAVPIRDGRAGEARLVAVGRDWFVNPVDRPAVVPLSATTLAAHWLRRTGGASSYEIHMSFSTDGGDSWGEPFVPHSDRATVQHGFARADVLADDALRLVWLDGRSSGGEREYGHMTLRAARVGVDGSVTERTELDGRVCSCCQPDLLASGNATLVVYRDRSDGEIRDVAVARVDGARVEAGRPVHDDGWRIGGCPFNGPALAATADGRVAAAWFTGAGDIARVRVAFSGDGGRQFGTPLEVARDTTLGDVDLVALGDGSTLVSWLGFGDGTSRVRMRRIDAHGNAAPAVTLLESSVPFYAPRLVCAGSALLLGWGQRDGSVSAARLDVGPVRCLGPATGARSRP